MALTLEILPQLGEELEQEAQQAGVSVAEHATLLLYLSVALMKEDEQTLFQQAVRQFLAEHALDADQLALVLEELIHQCLADQEEDNTARPSSSSVAALTSKDAKLRAWRNGIVHQSIDESVDVLITNVPPQHEQLQHSGRKGRRHPTAMGKYAYISGSSDEFAQEKQKEIDYEERKRA